MQNIGHGKLSFPYILIAHRQEIGNSSTISSAGELFVYAADGATPNDPIWEK
jgi:hypothetical protein